MSPTILRVRGYRFFFFSNDSHEPIHVHVESSGNYAKFWLKPVRLSRNRGYSAHELRKLHTIIEKHEDVIEGEWNEFFGY